MLSKKILLSMRCNFMQRYERLWQQDKEVLEAFEELRTLFLEKGIKEENIEDMEDGIYSFLPPLTVLAYYMGIQDGADMLKSLTDAGLTEKILMVTGNWVEENEITLGE